MGADGERGRPRSSNRSLVLDLLGRSAPVSRAEVIRLTGLSRSTVSSIVKKLIAEGQVQEIAGALDSSPRASGRPPALLSLSGAPGVLVGVDIGHRHVRVAVSDLSAAILAEEEVTHDVDHAAAQTLDLAATMVVRCLRRAKVGRDRVVGVGMGVPGPIDPRSGTIVSPILPGWVALLPAAELSRRLGLPVRADNDANIGALGELSYGSAHGYEDVIYVKVAGGIGAGLVLAGRAAPGRHWHCRRDRPRAPPGRRTVLSLRKPWLPRDTGGRAAARGAAEAGVRRAADRRADAGAGPGRRRRRQPHPRRRGPFDRPRARRPEQPPQSRGHRGWWSPRRVGLDASRHPRLGPALRPARTAAALRVTAGSLGERAGVVGALALAKDTTGVMD